ncbi:MAG: peptidylprolyl isomerase [Oscillospiraceae bacterium]
MIMKKTLSFIVSVVLSLSMFTGCTATKVNDVVSIPSIKQLQPPSKSSDIAVITTSMGIIKIRFFPEEAPKAVENFIALAKGGYYDGLTFHNVVNNNTIQTGDPTGTGSGGESIWKERFADELHPQLGHIYGAVSMANSGKDTNGSQFFIVTNNDTSSELIADLKTAKYPQDLIDAYAQLGGLPALNGNNTIFGQVIEGMDIAKKISQVSTDIENVPIEPVMVQSIVIEKVQ